MPLDEFNLDVDRAEWLFTLALGFGLGLVLAALVIAFRRRPGWRVQAAVLGAVGLLLSALTGTLAVDAAPWSLIDLRLKVYLSGIVFTAAMVMALAIGAVLAAAIALTAVILADRAGWPRLVASGAAIAAAIIMVATVLPLAQTAAGGSRHPSGTNTANTVDSERVITGLDIPTGISVGANGDILVTELAGRRAAVFRPNGDGGAYELLHEIPLGLGDGLLGFHGAFHPAYPEEPYAYVVTHGADEAGLILQVLRVSLDGAGTVETAITGLPTARDTASNHHGAGLIFCHGYLFVSTSDSDSIVGPAVPGSRRYAERAKAQSPTAGVGKVLRWRLDGIELVPDGVFGAEFPAYAMGFRNPFGIGCDESTGHVLVADNGERGNDQVRLAEPGSNHGWPLSFVRNELGIPWFDADAARIAPTGVVGRTGAPDTLVVSAFQSQALYELTIDREAPQTTAVRLLTEVDGGAYSVAIGPDNCVYFTDVESVRRLQEPGCE